MARFKDKKGCDSSSLDIVGNCIAFTLEYWDELPEGTMCDECKSRLENLLKFARSTKIRGNGDLELEIHLR